LLQNEPNNTPDKVTVSSVKYHVNVAQDAKSAREKFGPGQKLEIHNTFKDAEKSEEQTSVAVEGTSPNSESCCGETRWEC
jgi:hypothetical protein